MKKSKAVLVSVLLLVLVSCHSTAPLVKADTYTYTGVWHDRSGLDGCSWMIQLSHSTLQNQEWLIPINLTEYAIKLEEGKVIQFNCELIQQNNVCMAGATIKLTSIKH